MGKIKQNFAVLQLTVLLVSCLRQDISIYYVHIWSELHTSHLHATAKPAFFLISTLLLKVFVILYVQPHGSYIKRGRRFPFSNEDNKF